MTREHSWQRSRGRVARLATGGVAAVVIFLAAALVPFGGAEAQTAGPPGTACTVAGRPCFGADQQDQLAKVGDDVMARRVPAGSPVAAAIRQFVDYWVGYSVALGYTVAFSYLPG